MTNSVIRPTAGELQPRFVALKQYANEQSCDWVVRDMQRPSGSKFEEGYEMARCWEQQDAVIIAATLNKAFEAH